MKIVISVSEEEYLIDIAIKEGVHGMSEFHLWLSENRDRIIDMFQPHFSVEYGGKNDESN